jgi:acyl dehydratase
MPYYEDFEMGKKVTTEGRTITDGLASVLISMMGYPAPVFNDETVAKETALGWRALPGPIILALMVGMGEESRVRMGKEGGGALIGINNVTWKAPVRVGDTIRAEWEVISMRKSSNPRWGIVVDRYVLKNQQGEEVHQAETTHVWEYRPKSK